MEEVKESAVAIEGTIGEPATPNKPAEAPEQGPEEPAVEAPPEEPTEDVSEDEKTEGAEDAPEGKEKTVPYTRFKEVIDQNKVYKEMMQAKGPQQPPAVESTVANPTASPTVSEGTSDEVADALKIIDQRVEAKTSQLKSHLQSQIDFDRTVRDHPDFMDYKDKIKGHVTANPNLSWDQAYKLAAYDSSQSKALETGKKQAYGKISEKERAGASPTKKAPTRSMPSGEVNAMAKDPKTGKFLHSVKELEEVLPIHEQRT